MNAAEAAAVFKKIGGMFPATARMLPDVSAAAWVQALIKADIPQWLAERVLDELMTRRTFVHPSDIIQGAQRMRQIARRSIAHLVPKGDPPPEVAEYLAHLKDLQRRERELADEAILQGAIDFSTVDLAEENDWGDPLELPVDPNWRPAPPRAQLPGADPARARQIVADAMPRATVEDDTLRRRDGAA